MGKLEYYIMRKITACSLFLVLVESLSNDDSGPEDNA